MRPDELLLPERERWPILTMLVPAGELPRELRSRPHPRSVAEVIITLNDAAGWTRNMIADWVEQFENRHAADPVVARTLRELDTELDLPLEESDEQDEAGLCVAAR
jgi:hypothetical protein